MKITDIEIEKVMLPFKEPFVVAFAVITHSENLIIKVKTDNGLVGYGEASPFAPVTGETVDSAYAMLKLFRDELIGLDPHDLETIHKKMNSVTTANPAAKCAVDLAMYDLIGKQAQLPVYKILGGYSNKLENDITIGIMPPDKMAQTAKKLVEEDNYRILKIKVGINLKEDIEAITKIREAVGPNVIIRADANQGYCVSDALKALDTFRNLGVEAVEQCLPYWNLDGAAFIRRTIGGGIKVMLDESIHSPQDAAKACKLEAADILNIKLMKCGGLYPALDINAVAQAFGIECMVGCMSETRLAITAGMSLVAAKKNIVDSDCDSFSNFEDSATGITGGFTFDGSDVTLNDKPGFGIDVAF